MKSNAIKRLFLIVIASCLCLVAYLPRADSAVDLDEAAVQYTNLCASCHGSSGTDLFPNKDSYTSASDLIDIYDSIGAHGSVSCDTDCVENTNTYIWEVLWGNTTSSPDAETAADLYATKCASCHGDSATDAFPNLATFTSAAELIAAYAGVTTHSYVDSCGDDCVQTTNTYIWETLWGNGLSAAELYTLKCARCHGALAEDYFPNKNTFTSEAELISAYADVGAHAHVETCGVTCIETTNAYVWNSLWDNSDPENTGCFIESLKP